MGAPRPERVLAERHGLPVKLGGEPGAELATALYVGVVGDGVALTFTERTSADADAPNRRVPFITGDVLRVHPSDWTEWLTAQSLEVPKKDALAVLKDAGLVQKVYALPGEDGKSAGFYTGTAPAGTEELPRARRGACPGQAALAVRQAQRGAARAAGQGPGQAHGRA